MKRLSILCAAAVLIAMGSSRASAGFVPQFVSSSNVLNTTVLIYTLNFTTNTGGTEQLQTGDFITLYDVGPVTSVTTGPAPAGTITNSQSLLGLTAPSTTPTDASNILNLTLTYNGPTLSVDTPFTNVQITVPITTLRLGTFTSTDTIPLGKNGQIGQVTLPNAVPEPTSIVMGGIAGLAGLGLTWGRRNRQS